MVIEAGVIAGYVIAWVIRKARRAGGRLDAEVDTAIDSGLDKLHKIVAERLGSHPVLDDLNEEVGREGGQVSELTRQQVELALTAAARKDDEFGHEVTELVAHLRAVERSSGNSVVAGSASRIFTGDVQARATGSGIVFGQVGGDVDLDRSGGERGDPSEPGRSSH